MKCLFILMLMIFFVSCSTSNSDTIPSDSGDFLTPSEVLNLFKNKKEDFDDLKMTPEVVKRLGNLDNEVDFLEGVDELVIEDASEQFMGVQNRIRDVVDLRKYANPIIRDQINGRCTAYGMAATLEVQACINHGFCDHKLSEAHSWKFDSNYSCKTKVESHLQNYIALDKYWKHNKKYPEIYDVDKKGFVKINHGWYYGNNHNSVINALNNDLAVYIGQRTPSSMVKCNKAVKFSTPLEGGHALSVMGYYHFPEETDLKYILILKNSWGKECGDGGYQYMPISICNKEGYYCMFWAFDKLDIKEENSN